MARCHTCDYPITDECERVGARCPSCHLPLHEPGFRKARFARPGEKVCAHHPAMQRAVDCARCRKHACQTCRTRWRGQVLCAACADTALANGESIPVQAQASNRQALASVLLAITAWLLAALAVWQMRSGPSRSGDWTAVVIPDALASLFGLALVASVAVGQAVAALRGQTEKANLAVAGLCLGGLYVGVLFGLGALSLWQG